MNKILLSVMLISLILTNSAYCQEENNDSNLVEAELKIRIAIGDDVLTATMYENSTTIDFLSMLPLTLKLEDYARTERISYLPRKLSIKDAPFTQDAVILATRAGLKSPRS